MRWSYGTEVLLGLPCDGETMAGTEKLVEYGLLATDVFSILWVENGKTVYDAVYLISSLSQSIRKMVDEKTSAKTMMLQGPNNKNKLKKTLLLDLDETLIHTSFV